MNHRTRLLIVGFVIGLTSASLAQDPGAAAPPGHEFLTRGPIHESYAQPVVYDPKPGPVIPKAPPAPIREAPPDQKPEGANVQWISGYWSWDDGRNDYLWVSGVWRNIPPGRQWVPGYWHEVPGGVQWAPGIWMVEQANTSNYLPAPPPSLEAGPSSPEPVAGAVWAPGCWVWDVSTYVWRPGFWVAPQPNWVWIPAQYVWTPGGYLFAEGYWDRPFDRRGQLFAPVYFTQPVYVQPTYVYQPTIGIVASGLVASLFVRPSFGVYYFGDYYAPSYFSTGIYPSYAYHQSRYGYDPIFSYYSVTYRTSNPGWGMQAREAYLYRREHIEARPPATYVEMNRISRTNITVNNTTIINNNVRNVSFAQPIQKIAASRDPAIAPHRFDRINAAEQHRYEVQANKLQALREERGQVERGAPRQFREPRPAPMPRSPIAAEARHPAHEVAARPAIAERANHHPTPVPAASAISGSSIHHPAASPHVAPPAPAMPHADPRIQPHPAHHPMPRPEPHPEAHHMTQPLPHPAASHAPARVRPHEGKPAHR